MLISLLLLIEYGPINEQSTNTTPSDSRMLR